MHSIKMNKKTFILLSLAVLMSLMICGTAAALKTTKLTPVDACTNYAVDGILYFAPVNLDAVDVNDWRSALTTTSPDMTIVGMEMVVVNDSTRYQCTEELNNITNIYEYSCNSVPKNAVVKGIYFWLVPATSVTESQPFSLTVKSEMTGEDIFSGSGTVKYPAYPCAVNQEKKDLLPADGEAFVVNTNESCTAKNIDPVGTGTSDSRVIMYEDPDKPFKMVNAIPADTIEVDRFHLIADPLETDYDYRVTYVFNGADDVTYRVSFDYDAATKTFGQAQDETGLEGESCDDVLPFILDSVEITEVTALNKDLWNNYVYPASTNFDFKFYYENENGNLGYENSTYHCERTANIQFAPYCSDNGKTVTTAATEQYDPCGSKRQLFTVNFWDGDNYILVPGSEDSGGNTVSCSDPAFCTSEEGITVSHGVKPTKADKYYFVTRKCTDSSCSTLTETSAYPYSLTVTDGEKLSNTYKVKDVSGKTTATYNMYAWDDTNRPFQIKSASMAVSEPGTYEVRGFISQANIKAKNYDQYAVKFYVTVNGSSDIKNCSTSATDSWYTSLWNDCLDSGKTQLLPFEPKTEGQMGSIRNKSKQGVYYKFSPEYSYVPQVAEVAKLSCEFSSIGEGSGFKKGHCSKDEIYVPPYTEVKIKSGSFYADHLPKETDEDGNSFIFAYRRADTNSMVRLYMRVGVKECDNAKKIPNTGVSLRSPLKANIKGQTSFVFTGNSLRIPAIGLGMETPIPIVHVYYDEGTVEKGWDLSTLGNYVGELEGSTYLPYAGNSALTGHNYSQGVFKNLEYVNLGDEIIIFGNDGIKYTYHVTEKFISQPYDVYSLFQLIGERSVTLVTCDNYNLVTDEYERRTVVRATIVSQEPYEVNW